MDVLDLVREAVENSVEAGASCIAVTVNMADGSGSVVVTDDGWLSADGDPFERGSTTKGVGRGEGLALIREASSGRCSLEREDGRTVLRFHVDDARLGEGLSSSLLPIFLFPAEIALTIDMAGRSMTLRTGELRDADAFPDRAGAIGRFREMVRQKEGEIYG